MSATNEFETNLLKLIYQNIAWANIGDANGLQPSATAGNFYISLHTADPGETGDQTTSEAAYTDYARVAVERSASGFSISGNQISNAAAISFPLATGGNATATHFGIGTAASGAGHLLKSGALDAPLAISNGITPSFAIGALKVTAD